MFMDSNKNHFLFFLRCATRRELPLSLSPVNTQHLPPWSRRLTGLRLGLRDSELGPYLVRNLLARPRFQIPLLLLETREGIMHPSFTLGLLRHLSLGTFRPSSQNLLPRGIE